MTSLTSSLLKTGRAAAVALALGASVVTAMPVQAASEPSFNFQLGVGKDGNVMSFGADSGNGRRDHDRRDFRPFHQCVSNREVLRGLRDYGFDYVDIVRDLSRTRVAVVGEWRNRTYAMKVNKCTGEVYDVQRLRKQRGQPGFSLQFNF